MTKWSDTEVFKSVQVILLLDPNTRLSTYHHTLNQCQAQEQKAQPTTVCLAEQRNLKQRR